MKSINDKLPEPFEGLCAAVKKQWFEHTEITAGEVVRFIRTYGNYYKPPLEGLGIINNILVDSLIETYLEKYPNTPPDVTVNDIFYEVREAIKEGKLMHPPTTAQLSDSEKPVNMSVPSNEKIYQWKTSSNTWWCDCDFDEYLARCNHHDTRILFKGTSNEAIQ